MLPFSSFFLFFFSVQSALDLVRASAITPSISDRSRWMDTYKTVLENKTLVEIDMPGAHHAGYLNVNWWVKIAEKWSVCQEESITANLNRGIRYLDLRLGESKNIIYFSHTILSRQKFMDGMDEIKVWLEEHPHEIVILDIQRDGDWNGKDKTSSQLDKLPALLKAKFGSLLLDDHDVVVRDLGKSSSRSSKTYKQLVQENKRVAVVGNDDVAALPSLSSWAVTKSGNWGHVVDNVMDWILQKSTPFLNSRRGILSISSAAVTPEVGKDISWPGKVAHDLNKLLTERIREVKPGTLLGVIEHDFASDDLIEAVIYNNLRSFRSSIDME